MILQDLKLLVDVAWNERHGQNGVMVRDGFRAAKKRLVFAGLLQENPTFEDHVTMTKKGDRRVIALMMQVKL